MGGLHTRPPSLIARNPRVELEDKASGTNSVGVLCIHNILIKLCIGLLIGLAVFLFFLPRVTAAPSNQSEDFTSGTLIIKDNAIQTPNILIGGTSTAPTKAPVAKTKSVEKLQTSGQHSTYTGREYSKEEVQQLIRDYSFQYGISADVPLRIAWCESGYNSQSKNKSSSASGVYQWLNNSWANQPASENNTISVFNADANIKAAVWLIANGKTSGWNSSIKCWK